MTIPAHELRIFAGVGDFKNLRAWQEATRLVLLSSVAIKKLPLHERYLLADRWRSATYAVALNIAEGATRKGPREFRRFLDLARSSLHRLEGILELVETLGYLREEDLQQVRQSRADCARMVYGLLRKMSAAGDTTVRF